VTIHPSDPLRDLHSPQFEPRAANSSDARALALRVLLLAASILALLLLIRLDVPIMRRLSAYPAMASAPPLDLLRILGEYRVPTIACILAFGLDRRGLRIGAATLIASLLALLAVQIVKDLIDRERPFRIDFAANPPWNIGWHGFWWDATRRASFEAFPSGHSAAAFAVWLTLATFYPRAAPLLAALAVGAACSRFLQWQHWPSDCLAGALIGIGCARIGLRASARLLESRQRSP